MASNQQPATSSRVPIAWTIAGSDSGGGAGIQADLKVMAAFGVHGCSAITAITAQNTLGIHGSEPVSETMLRAQLGALHADLPPATIKTGMLGNATTVKAIAEFLHSSLMLQAPHPFLICDPVLKSTSGLDLFDPEALEILINQILPKVDVLTPNLPETEKLAGGKLQSIETAAEKILRLGVGSVLIKGGHAAGGTCRDYWTNGERSMWLSSPRVETPATHGTGCILASAIAAAIALGQDIPEAVVTAKTFLNQCLKSPAGIGAGHGPMRIELFRNDPQDRPEVIVGGIADPAPKIPATTTHSHLQRLSKIFVGDPAYFITTNTKNRRQILSNPAVHKILREEWNDALKRHGWAIGSYVVMPDHVHFFCRPTHEACKLSELMQPWKQWTSKRIKKELHLDDSVWQGEFFDHLLRPGESYSEKRNYVEQNPVRAGLVEDATDWPYAGFIHYK